MSIIATVDGTAYTGIEAITTGGKTISLTESGGGGGSVGQFTEYNTVTQILTVDSSGNAVIPHGLSQAPKYFKVTINTSDISELRGIVAGVQGEIQIGTVRHGIVFTTNASTGAVVPTDIQYVDTLATVAQYTSDATNIYLGRGLASQQYSSTLSYVCEFYA